VAFQKLLQIVEAFAQETGSDFTASTYSQLDAANSEISLHLKWNNTSLNNTMCNLALVGNRVLQGKSDVIHFIKEMVTALEFISVLKPQVRSTNCLAISEAHEELERVQERFAAVDEELERLRIEKAEIESHLKEANNQVENLKAQLHQGERFIVTDRLVRHQVLDPKLHLNCTV
jgi:chromosome segregation ATPase